MPLRLFTVAFNIHVTKVVSNFGISSGQEIGNKPLYSGFSCYPATCVHSDRSETDREVGFYNTCTTFKWKENYFVFQDGI
jgi:hypothetical protein